MDEQPQRVALIVGGTSRMGKAIAVELARRGWSIFLQHAGSSSADESVADVEAAADLSEAGAQVEVLSAPADLASAQDRDQLIEQVLETFERIDMLVNTPPAAAAGPTEDLLEITEDAYRRVMDAAVTSTLFLTQLAANEMVRLVESGLIENPKIVTINSIGAYTTSADHGTHCMSASALAMMTRLFADRLGEHGINVYEIRVGLISTGLSDAVHARYESLIAEGLTPIRRWGRTQDVARAVAAVAEDLLTFSTGQVIDVDGGFHLRRL